MSDAENLFINFFLKVLAKQLNKTEELITNVEFSFEFLKNILLKVKENHSLRAEIQKDFNQKTPQDYDDIFNFLSKTYDMPNQEKELRLPQFIKIVLSSFVCSSFSKFIDSAYEETKNQLTNKSESAKEENQNLTNEEEELKNKTTETAKESVKISTKIKNNLNENSIEEIIVPINFHFEIQTCGLEKQIKVGYVQGSSKSNKKASNEKQISDHGYSFEHVDVYDKLNEKNSGFSFDEKKQINEPKQVDTFDENQVNELKKQIDEASGFSFEENQTNDEKLGGEASGFSFEFGDEASGFSFDEKTFDEKQAKKQTDFGFDDNRIDRKLDLFDQVNELEKGFFFDDKNTDERKIGALFDKKHTVFLPPKIPSFKTCKSGGDSIIRSTSVLVDEEEKYDEENEMNDFALNAKKINSLNRPTFERMFKNSNFVETSELDKPGFHFKR